MDLILSPKKELKLSVKHGPDIITKKQLSVKHGPEIICKIWTSYYRPSKQFLPRDHGAEDSL